MSDPVLLGLIGTLGTLLTTIASGVIAVYMAKLNRKADVAAAKTEEVKETLAEVSEHTEVKLSEMSIVARDTHTLVNANMGRQLKISAVALRRVADITNDADDISAAEDAESIYQEHMTKQWVVDGDHVKDLP